MALSLCVRGAIPKIFTIKKRNMSLILTKEGIFGLTEAINVLAEAVHVSLRNNLLFREPLALRKLRKQSKRNTKRLTSFSALFLIVMQAKTSKSLIFSSIFWYNNFILHSHTKYVKWHLANILKK